MRYAKNERSVLVGKFTSGRDIRITLLAVDTDNKLTLDTDMCIESQEIPGIYTWDTVNINISNKIDHYSNLVYIMHDTTSGDEYLGKFTYSGYLDTRFDNIDNALTEVKIKLEDLNKLDNIITDIEEVIAKLNTFDKLNENYDNLLISVVEDFTKVKSMVNTVIINTEGI